MVRVTFQGYIRDRKDPLKVVKWFTPFHEIHKTEEDARIRALALNWVILDIEQIKDEKGA
jgi:hypothetical protein